VARSSARRAGRIIVLSICTLIVAVLFAGVVRQSWQLNGASADVVRRESHGAEIMHPLTTLVANLVETQSAAVRGQPVDAENVRESLAAVAVVDEKYGVELQTQQRLRDLTSQVETALKERETGQEAYDRWSGLVKLAVDLQRQVGDASHMIHDAEIDSYYLMDAAIIRLPDAMVLAGRAADLVALAGGRSLDGEDAEAAAVARFGVSTAADQVRVGLNKSVNFTSRADLGSNITERLDAFQAAADAFAPPTMFRELAGTVDAATLAANAQKVSAAAAPLAHRLLSELQALLDDRAGKLRSEWRFTITSAGAIAALGLIMLWLLALTRRRPARDEVADEARPAEDVPVGSLAYARQLLDDEELVHVGRAVRTRQRERDDAR
jgi:hypothetical protein